MADEISFGSELDADYNPEEYQGLHDAPMNDAHIEELLLKLHHLKDEIDSAESHIKMLKAEREELTTRVVSVMDGRGVGGMTVNGYNFSISSRSFASIREGQREAALQWLRDNGHGDIITESVHSGTLALWAKTEIESGSPIPEELINVFNKKNISIRKK